MQNYLYRLAVRALGQPTALRPLAAPLFAPSPSVAPSAGVEAEAGGQQWTTVRGGKQVEGNDRLRSAKPVQPTVSRSRGHVPLERTTESERSPRMVGRPAVPRQTEPQRPASTPNKTPLVATASRPISDRPRGVAPPLPASDAAVAARPSHSRRSVERSGTDTLLRVESTTTPAGDQKPAASGTGILSSPVVAQQTRTIAPPQRGATIQDTRVLGAQLGGPEPAERPASEHVGQSPPMPDETSASSPPASGQPVTLRTLLPASRPAYASTPPGPSSARIEAGATERPVVKVTIGRIEVRAVAPPVPTRPAPQRTRKLLSLDEYLGRQSRGKR
jgi:hypothetical protein